ncbi:hypothetical protein BGW80DRAFT_445799 [Lactifluus volemus]|nr:hypothetical protein BGW80DRAFT_445799 [Lactifluus volemus]
MRRDVWKVVMLLLIEAVFLTMRIQRVVCLVDMSVTVIESLHRHDHTFLALTAAIADVVHFISSRGASRTCCKLSHPLCRSTCANMNSVLGSRRWCASPSKSANWVVDVIDNIGTNQKSSCSRIPCRTTSSSPWVLAQSRSRRASKLLTYSGPTESVTHSCAPCANVFALSSPTLSDHLCRCCRHQSLPPRMPTLTMTYLHLLPLLRA